MVEGHGCVFASLEGDFGRFTGLGEAARAETVAEPVLDPGELVRAGRSAQQAVVQSTVVGARVDGRRVLGDGLQPFGQVVRDGCPSASSN